MKNKPMRFHSLGEPDKTNTIFTRDVTEIYDSKIPLIASRRFYHYEHFKEVEENNKNGFDNLKRWFVSQYHHRFDDDRVGIKCFRMVRMDLFDALWRKPISPYEYNVKVDIERSGFFHIYGPNREWIAARAFNLDWEEHREGLVWLYKNNVLMYPFTDKDRMFVNPEDELAYIADVLNRDRDN